MTIKVGINGFGRIGRMVFPPAIKDFPDIEIVGINDLLEPDYLAYMLKYDSVHGRFKGDIAVDGGNDLIVNGKKIRLTAVKDPAELKWNEVGADIVVDSTGLFLTKETAANQGAAGAKKVIMSAPSKDDTPMFVFGVNHDKYAGGTSSPTPPAPPTAWPRGQGAERQLGHQARPDDHRARRHRHPEDRGRPSNKGLARRPRHPGEHHPLLHRRRQGCRRGAARTVGKAHLAWPSASHLRRLGGRPHRRTEQGKPLRRNLRRHEGCLRRRHEGHPATPRKVVATDFRGGESCTSVFDAEAGIALDKTFRQGRFLVRQRVGLLLQGAGDGPRHQVRQDREGWPCFDARPCGNRSTRRLCGKAE